MDKLPHGKQEITVSHPHQFSGTQGTPLPGKTSPWLKSGTGKVKGESAQWSEAGLYPNPGHMFIRVPGLCVVQGCNGGHPSKTSH